MKHLLLPLVLMACTHATRAPIVEASAEAAPPVAEPIDASQPEASAPEPTACSDAGPPAWYLVSSGTKCNSTSTLEWLDDDRTPHLFTATPPLLGALTWTAEMPDCFGANAIITQARAIDDHTFAVTIDGHDNGGSGCHAGFLTHFEGRVIIDAYGAITRADFIGTETTSADDVPSCRALVGVKRVAAHVRRACKP